MLNDIRSILQNLNNAKNWSLQVLQIKPSKRAGTEYTGRESLLIPPVGWRNYLKSLNFISEPRAVLMRNLYIYQNTMDRQMEKQYIS